MRHYMALLTEAAAEPTFAAIARSPLKYADSLRDALFHYGEDNYLEEYSTKRDIADHLGPTARQYVPLIKGGMMPIYRGITVNADWNPAVQGLGIYWTHNIDKAWAFWGNHDDYIVLHGTVAEHDIDLWRTLVSEFTALTEAEITLYKKSTVRLLQITKHGTPVLSQFVGKSYNAIP